MLVNVACGYCAAWRLNRDLSGNKLTEVTDELFEDVLNVTTM